MFFPVCAIGLLSFVTFAFDASGLDTRATVLVTLVLTIVAFKCDQLPHCTVAPKNDVHRFVIADKLPSVPYLTIVDKYTLIVFGILCEQLSLQVCCVLTQLYRCTQFAPRL
jgi:hypothetical protein